MKNIQLVALLLIVSSGLFAQSKKEQEVWQRIEQLNTAIFVKKDSAALAGLLAENVTYGHSGGKIEGKAEMIKNAVHNETTYREVGMDKTSIFFEGNMAIVRHVFNAMQNEKGKESPLKLSVLHVWQKQGKEWKLLARQSVKM
ncbi:MAG TPA: nuclear transport factor 2 family protein [Chitinophagaceae bacterium]|nr:nuclear transport factor 2 family protein [Chitinophagaceae bacterium]